MTPNDWDNLKTELNRDPYKNPADRYKSVNIIKEFLYSFVIALLPALGSLIFYISNHQDASGSEAGRWSLWSLIIFIIIIFIIRLSAPRKLLKMSAIVLLIAMPVFMIFLLIDTRLVCHVVGGEWKQYVSENSRDIHGSLVYTPSSRDRSLIDPGLCIVSSDKVQKIKENKSFFYTSATFIVQ